jgi:DNA polymerase III alpha subunit
MRVRTGYSFRHAVGRLEEVAERLKTIGYPVLPISDRASTFGYVRWMKLAKKMELRPIFGVELGVAAMQAESEASVTAKRPIIDHWTFFAIDSLRPINDLIELATEQFRYEPLLSYVQAMRATGVIKIAGSRSRLDEMTPQSDLFVSLSPSSNVGYIRQAVEKGFPLIACSDNRYPTKQDVGLYEMICYDLKDGKRLSRHQSFPQYILSREQWEDATLAIPAELRAEAWSNFETACERSRATLGAAQLIKPERPMTMRAMCEAGAAKLGIDLSDEVYSSRLERELRLIEEKGFADYFYIIADVVQWARQKMWVGPARGSSCGSLVCYLAEITTIDPIKFGLIFERFIDINRSDLPDIDIDFSDQQRQHVFKYMKDKYGDAHVARLGTVAMYMPRSAISEAGGALGIPRWETEKVLDSLIERSSGDSRALQSLEDTLEGTPAGKALKAKAPEIAIAAKMEGHPRHSSSHAAGIIITERPVKDYIAIDARTGATQCDKKDAEELNFLKIDALGLTQGSIFEDALALAGLPSRYLEQIPLDDAAAFDVLNRSQWSGIFQFNGSALQSITKLFTVDCLDDIISVTALARPGPLASGGTNHWAARKARKEPVSFWHPVFEPYLKDTLGVVIYQEQVMEIGRNVGDLSWEDVTALRKAMSKSLGKEFFDKYGDRWKKGALSKGVPKDIADRVWDDMCAYGSWAFNKSHAVAYGHISYQCCWLKAHYPFEFAAATLSHEGEPMKQIMMLREMQREGIGYIPVDTELSTDKWTTLTRDDKRMLVGPLGNVKGIGPAMMEAVLRGRTGADPATFSTDPKVVKKMLSLQKRAMTIVGKGETKIDSLWPISDAFARLLPDPAAKDIYTEPTPIVKIMDPDPEDREYVIFAVAQRIIPRDANEPTMIQRRIAAGRQGKYTDGRTAYLNLRMRDDTEMMLAMVDRFKFPFIGKEIIDRGRAGRACYAMHGKVRGNQNLRMLLVDHVKYIGDMDFDISKEREERIGQKPYAGTGEGVGIAAPVTEDGEVVY